MMLKTLRIFNYVMLSLFAFVILFGGMSSTLKSDWLWVSLSIFALSCVSFMFYRNKSKRHIYGNSLFFGSWILYISCKIMFPSIWVVFAIVFGLIYIVGDLMIGEKFKVVEEDEK